MMANNYRLTFKGGQVLDLKLREVNNNLSAKERLVADYILANKPLLKSMSIQTLAKANDVSTTTILRLCHKLGYQGFSDLKIDLITSSGHPQHDKVLQEDINLDDSVETVNHKIQLIEKSSIDETHAIVNIEQLELAIALIRKSNKIVIYGAGSSGLVGKELEYQLIKIKKDVSCHADYSIQYSIVNTLDEHDLVIILSHSGENLESVKLLTMAQQLGVPSIAITKMGQSRISALATVLLHTITSESVSRLIPIRALLNKSDFG
ncbi:Sialic acid utilization regulator [Klebsiella oxytoca]|nr:Sialic acid utilization regulator [Klebsiella oxytoca]